MAVLLEVTFQDINQLESKSSMWVESEEISADVIVALKAASNAKIVRATLSTTVPIASFINNNAVAANVETAACKAICKFRALDPDSTGDQNARVTVGIPAPIGTLINSLSGDNTNADVHTLMRNTLSKTGVQMTTVESIKYKR